MQCITFIAEKSIYKNKIDIYSICDLKNYIRSTKGSKKSFKQIIKNVAIYSYHVTRTEYKLLKEEFLEVDKSFNEYFGL